MRVRTWISEQRFRLRNYSPRRLGSARRHLFEFDEVRDVTHPEGDNVVVRYEGDAPDAGGRPRELAAAET
jgi:hypothetical protein